MGILKLILLILGIIVIVAPILAFLCTKWGVAGFYRGKEAMHKRRIDIDTSNKNVKKNFN